MFLQSERWRCQYWCAYVAAAACHLKSRALCGITPAIQEYSFFNLDRFTAWKETRYPLYTWLSGPMGQSERVWKTSPLPGFDSRAVKTVTSRYTDWAIVAPAEIFINVPNLRLSDVWQSGCNLCNTLWLNIIGQPVASIHAARPPSFQAMLTKLLHECFIPWRPSEQLHLQPSIPGLGVSFLLKKTRNEVRRIARHGCGYAAGYWSLRIYSTGCTNLMLVVMVYLSCWRQTSLTWNYATETSFRLSPISHYRRLLARATRSKL